MNHSLTLLDNSISFFNESLRCCRNAEGDPGYWKFAIVHLVQAMELAIKESLRRVHPVMVYDNIDKPRLTVSISKGLARLKSEAIGGYTITESEEDEIRSAIRIRNELVHYECAQPPQLIEAKFASVYAFVVFFYQRHLGLELADIMPIAEYERLLGMKKSRDSLLAKADQYLSDNDVGDVWQCPECNKDTFVVGEEKCCFCGHAAEIVTCPNCGSEAMDGELIDLIELFDYGAEEGRAFVVNDYGYSEARGCPQCIDDIRADIENQRSDQYYEDMAMEAYYAKKHGR